MYFSGCELSNLLFTLNKLRGNIVTSLPYEPNALRSQRTRAIQNVMRYINFLFTYSLSEKCPKYHTALFLESWALNVQSGSVHAVMRWNVCWTHRAWTVHEAKSCKQVPVSNPSTPMSQEDAAFREHLPSSPMQINTPRRTNNMNSGGTLWLREVYSTLPILYHRY